MKIKIFPTANKELLLRKEKKRDWEWNKIYSNPPVWFENKLFMVSPQTFPLSYKAKLPC